MNTMPNYGTGQGYPTQYPGINKMRQPGMPEDPNQSRPQPSPRAYGPTGIQQTTLPGGQQMASMAMTAGQPAPLPTGYVPSNPPPVPGINNIGGMNVLTPPAPGSAASMAPWSFTVPQFGQQGQTGQSPATPQMPSQPQMPTPQAQAPQQGLPADYQQLMDATPYNRAIDRGNQFIGTIPNSSAMLQSLSPAFRNLSPNLSSALNNQWQNMGQGMRDEAGLEFARKAGTEIPQFQLAQQLGLRGLQNDWSDLGNDFYRNQVSSSTGGLTSLLRMLGAVGSFL